MKPLLFLFLSIIPILTTAQIYEAELKPKGVIFPRMNTDQRGALTNVTLGQTVFDTEQQKIFWMEDMHGWVTPSVFKQFSNSHIVLDQRLWNRGNLIFTHQGGQFLDTLDGSSAWGNTVMGVVAGQNLTSSTANTIIGHYAGNSQKSGHGNIYVGENAGKNVDSSFANTFIGTAAGEKLVKGYGNIALGTSALKEGTGKEIQNNVVIGHNAFREFPNGWDNVVIGASAGQQADTLYGAIMIGYRAGYNSNAANVFIGNVSGENAKDSYGNTFVGHATGQNCSTGWGNTLIGNAAGQQIGEGGENTFIGDVAGSNLIDGYRNTLIGQLAGLNLVSGSGNVYLGRQVGASPDYETPFSEDNTLRIHNSPDSSPLIMGKFDARTLNINGALTIRDFVHLTPTSAPSTPEKGMLYYDSNDDKVKVWNGLTWEALSFISSTSETEFMDNQNGRNSLCRTSCMEDLQTKLKQQEIIITKQATQLTQQQSQIEALQKQMSQLIAAIETTNKTSIQLKSIAYLAQNQPNPFNGYTSISYFVPSHVKKATIQITNANGIILKKVNLQGAGEGALSIQMDDFSTGTYFYSLVLDGIFLETKRMIVK